MIFVVYFCSINAVDYMCVSVSRAVCVRGKKKRPAKKAKDKDADEASASDDDRDQSNVEKVI